ncbi:GMC family oxidoreductase [Klebsiella pneumoniae]|uniref:GMC oxidoreductase n=1 Tax=Klebsiella pneumoniae TaxID=573 RepID=UPI00164BF54F|nr:GMC family oxidoreductase [Klebsiella pneumoniae]MBC3838515.1 GMC family oxidoreductase [Klebsiella pneumoniae]MDP0896600.1 GMC family oxidoreductase [Klebsiella pneumoniae]MEC4058831.1 GMC family oxidoreductase [Klebsiella pneumoniae]
MKKECYDAIVVGSGVAGSIAVKELTEKGMNVILLEAGPFLGEKDFPVTPGNNEKIKKIDAFARFKIALTGQPLQARAAYMSNEYRHLFVNDWQNPYTTPKGQYFLWIRGRQLGGRLHTYGRVLQRMSDYDFKAASYDGYGQDWPISYEELAPWYTHIEVFLGVYGTEENIPNLPDGKYIQAPILTKPEKVFKSKVESIWPERKVISWRFSTPNLKRIPVGVQAAIDTGRLELRTDAIAKQIDVDPVSGKAIGVTFVDRLTKQEHSVRGGMVMLCASAIESVRLLLNSRSSRHPEGIGNSTGLLGRYFLEQTPSLIAGSVPDSKGWEYDKTIIQDPFCRPAGGIVIPRFQNLGQDSQKNYLRGFAFQGVIGRGYVPPESPAQFGLMGFGEMLPRAENRITLNLRKKDAWGIPAPHIDCSFGANDLLVMKEQLRAIKEMVSVCNYNIDFAGTALGLEDGRNAMPNETLLMKTIFRLSFKKSVGLGAAIHESGGARMGNDPENSVLNNYNQCWDANNIFVTDGACFVTSGTVGPTLTMMAITARACDYAATQYKKGQL